MLNDLNASHLCTFLFHLSFYLPIFSFPSSSSSFADVASSSHNTCIAVQVNIQRMFKSLLDNCFDGREKRLRCNVGVDEVSFETIFFFSLFLLFCFSNVFTYSHYFKTQLTDCLFLTQHIKLFTRFFFIFRTYLLTYRFSFGFFGFILRYKRLFLLKSYHLISIEKKYH